MTGGVVFGIWYSVFGGGVGVEVVFGVRCSAFGERNTYERKRPMRTMARRARESLSSLCIVLL